jgi:cleavage and polyadenylation specificity factor subunit 4
MVDVMMMDVLPDITFEFERSLLDKETFPSGEGGIDEVPQKPGEICKYYLKGSCMKGASCPFRHSRNDRAVVCKHWLRGLCKKGDLCEFLHEYDLEKMPECYFFSKFGTYPNPCTISPSRT